MEGLDEFNFDSILDRRGTNSYKWDDPKVIDDNLLPLSIADMDFAVPSEITQALVARTATPIYGYEFQPDALKQAIVQWHSTRYGFEIQKDWIVFTPGVMAGVALCLLVFTEKGDPVLFQPPIYPPFFSVVKENQRQPLLNPLRYDPASLRYTMDFDCLEKLFSEQHPRLMLLCNPHNPVGRVWTREELWEVGELCKRYKVILVSDDIHADIVFSGHRYQPVLSVSETLKNNGIQLMSPGKSFNFPGLRVAYAVIANRDLRNRFEEKLSALVLTNTDIMAAVAAQAAYQKGAKWLDRVLEYIWDNYILLKTTLSSELPWARVIPLEGTYLAWIDLNASGLTPEQLSQAVLKKAKLMLFEGAAFGDEGKGFMRMNLACPRPRLQEAIERFVGALTGAKKNTAQPFNVLAHPSPSCKCCSG